MKTSLFLLLLQLSMVAKADVSNSNAQECISSENSHFCRCFSNPMGAGWWDLIRVDITNGQKKNPYVLSLSS